MAINTALASLRENKFALSGHRSWQLPCHSQDVISHPATFYRSCRALSQRQNRDLSNQKANGHLQWKQAAKLEASVRAPALVRLMVRVWTRHSSIWATQVQISPGSPKGFHSERLCLASTLVMPPRRPFCSQRS